MTNYTNCNPRRIVLRGDELPSLLLGSTFVDLRRVSQNFREDDYDIEFYQQRGVEGEFNTPSRFFIGRDSTQINQDVLVEGFDYRIELCECMPEFRHISHSPNELMELVRTFERNEPREGTGYSAGPGEIVRTTPSLRIYRFEIRPPFSETFIRETHRSSACNPGPLSSLIHRYIGLHDRDLPRSLRVTTEDLFNRYND